MTTDPRVVSDLRRETYANSARASRKVARRGLKHVFGPSMSLTVCNGLHATGGEPVSPPYFLRFVQGDPLFSLLDSQEGVPGP